MIAIHSDECSALPPDIFDRLNTNASLPVDHGTVVEVGCIPGYSLSGSRLITCNQDTSWEYEEDPSCLLREFSLAEYCVLHILPWVRALGSLIIPDTAVDREEAAGRDRVGSREKKGKEVEG